MELFLSSLWDPTRKSDPTPSGCSVLRVAAGVSERGGIARFGDGSNQRGKPEGTSEGGTGTQSRANKAHYSRPGQGCRLVQSMDISRTDLTRC
jgi:hypothetical protein